jgi:hypothetical protein
MPRVRLLIQFAQIGQCRDAGIATLGHDLEALGDQRTVKPDQGNHVADGSKGNDVKPVEEVRGRAAIVPPAGQA